jgi:ABC-type sugar transport system ATPase subunit
MSEYFLEMRSITKEFPGVRALDNVNFQVKKGEIHALVGENGAGKSTLMKILSGLYPASTYSGDIKINGKIQKFQLIRDSEKAGIAIIYQELTLVKQMNVCENIFLGNEIVKRGIIDWDQAFVATAKLLKDVKLNINPATKVLNLGIGQQQLVEIAKAMVKKADILVLDEPTAALTEAETQNLIGLLREFRQKGITCIFISHKLGEVFRIADRITVLRDGKTITTCDTSDLNEARLIALMVGRELTQRFPRVKHIPGEAVMEVKNWTVYDPEIEDRKAIDNISFTVRQGEILGIAGLMGAGRTELAMSIFGCYGIKVQGEIVINGQHFKGGCPRKAIRKGINYLSEDRKQFGLVLMMDVKKNISLASLDCISKMRVINQNEEIKFAEKFIAELHIKTPSVEQKVENLSGGNQQKVVLSKWLMTKPQVLILDEPTRGIDVGAKYEIYNIMNSLVEQGVSIVMISSELPEILGMSDRILVMHEGKINGELTWEEATQEKIALYATGGK